MKIKAKARGCQLSINVKPSRGETINEKELDRFSRIYLRGFFKVKQLKKNQFMYTGPIGISLFERLKKPISKRDFFFVIEQIVVAVQKLQANNMPIDHLVLDLKHVYINEVTKEVQFMYIPTVSGSQSTGLIEFIEAITYSAAPAEDEDTDFVSRFIYFFRSLNPFSVEGIERFIAKEDQSVVTTIKKQHSGQSGIMTRRHPRQPSTADHVDSDDENTALLIESDDDATGLLSEDNNDATDLLSTDDDLQTELLSQSFEDDATGLLSNSPFDENTTLFSENNSRAHYPTLLRVLTNETVSIDKPVFRLGKDGSCVDYFIGNSPTISRSHADIITRGDRYFIMDLDSKNHTYVNDQKLSAHFETEIIDGSRIRLAAEDFIFNI